MLIRKKRNLFDLALGYAEVSREHASELLLVTKTVMDGDVPKSSEFAQAPRIFVNEMADPTVCVVVFFCISIWKSLGAKFFLCFIARSCTLATTTDANSRRLLAPFRCRCWRLHASQTNDAAGWSFLLFSFCRVQKFGIRCIYACSYSPTPFFNLTDCVSGDFISIDTSETFNYTWGIVSVLLVALKRCLGLLLPFYSFHWMFSCCHHKASDMLGLRTGSKNIFLLSAVKEAL